LTTDDLTPTAGLVSTFFRALQRAEQELARRRHPTRSALPIDRGPAFSTASRAGLEQLRLLFDYLKFQISLYTILAVIFTAAIAFEPAVFKLDRGLLGLAVVFVCLAGMAAGIIASRCAHFTSSGELWATRIGPFRSSCLRGEYWSYLQHIFFGLALGAAVLAVFLGAATWPPAGISLPTVLSHAATCWRHWPPSCPPP
jgi:hypothetical protein